MLRTGLGFTVTVVLEVLAHCPALGVNWYVPLLTLLTAAGLQMPVMPLFEMAGKTGAVSPSHNAGSALKIGVTVLVTLTVLVATDEHPAALVTVAE